MGIQDKTELTKDEIAEIEEHLPGDYEDSVFGLDQIPPMRNLLLLKGMKPLKQSLLVSRFKKYVDGKALGSGSYLRYKYARIEPPDEDEFQHQFARVKEDDHFALEGERYQSEAQFLRRNRRIVREAQARYSAVCEACGDNLMKKYGLLGEGYVQFHHRKPLGDNPNPQLSSWKDLAPLCPDCHAMIHRTNPTMPVEQFKKEIIQSIKSS